jgi:hypothetical protein
MTTGIADVVASTPGDLVIRLGTTRPTNAFERPPAVRDNP